MRETVWPTVPFADVVGTTGLLLDGDWVETKDQNPDGEVRLIQLADIGIGEYLNKSNRRLTSDTARRLRCTLLRKNDILIARMPDPIGRACIFPGESSPCATVVDVCIVRPDAQVAEPRYLLHFLNSAGFQSSISNLIKGATRQRISRGNLQQVAVPLPPLNEQRRITTILDQADDLRRKRRQALGRLEQVYFSIFVEMFGDPIANPRGWPSNTYLGDVAEIVSGITKGRKLNGASTRRVPYLAVANVQDRILALDKVKTIEATESEITRFKLLQNDLLLTEGGDPDKLGRGALWQGEIANCIHQNHIFRVRLRADVVHPIFINWLIGGPRGKAYFLRSAKQTTGIASINATQLREFPLLLPPVDLQRAFAARVTELDKLKVHHRSHVGKLEALFASLQHRAFRGEL